MAATSLFGCTHTLSRPAWQCSAMIDTGEIRAFSHWLLNRDGTFLSGHDEWMRGFTLQPRDFHQVVWERSGSRDAPVDGVVTLRFHLAVAEPYRVELRSGSPSGLVLASGRLAELAATPEVVTAWSAMNRWLEAGPIYLAAADRRGTVVGSVRVDPTIYEQGLAMVRQTSAEVRAEAADYSRQCQPHEEIIVT